MFLSEVFNTDAWLEVKSVASEEEFLDLKLLGLQSKASSTIAQYERLFSKWTSFATQRKFAAMPADKSSLAIYFNILRKTTDSKSVLESSKSAIIWAHKIAGFPNPFDNTWLSNIVEGAIRATSTPSIGKKPVTIDIIKEICSHTDFLNLKSLRATCMCVLLFAGFFRISEILALKASDLNFYESHLSVFVKHSKTDQLNKGSHIVISSSLLPSCPVSITRNYLMLANIELESQMFLFRPLVFKAKNRYILSPVNKNICYSTARSIVLDAIRPFVDDVTCYGTHSFRRGGATQAANNSVDSSLLMRHGRWVSEKSKNLYALDSLEKKLSVSSSLGI